MHSITARLSMGEHHLLVVERIPIFVWLTCMRCVVKTALILQSRPPAAIHILNFLRGIRSE
jgi:hypothetical protein